MKTFDCLIRKATGIQFIRGAVVVEYIAGDHWSRGVITVQDSAAYDDVTKHTIKLPAKKFEELRGWVMTQMQAFLDPSTTNPLPPIPLGAELEEKIMKALWS